MRWVDIVLLTLGAANLTLGLIHLFIWLQLRRSFEHLLFVVIALSVGVLGIMEQRFLRTTDPAAFGELLRSAHVFVAMLYVSMFAYVRLRFRAGSLALGLTGVALRSAALAANFLTGVNLNFLQVTAMRPLAIWGGDTVYYPVGDVNPFAFLSPASNLFLLLFLLDAAREIWKRRTRVPSHHGVLVCLTMAGFLLGSSSLTALTNFGLLGIPLLLNAAFVVVVLVMAYDLGGEVVRGGVSANLLRESETRLRDSELRIALAAEATGLGLWSWDVGRDRVWVSENGRALFAISPNLPITFARFLKLLHPDDRERVQQGIHQSLVSGDTFQREYRVVMPDGAVRWVVSRGRIRRDEEGRAVTFYGISLDVSGDRLGDERFRTAVEAAPNAMLLIGADGHITLANAQAGKVFGYTREDLIGRSVETLLPDALRARHLAHRQGFGMQPSTRTMSPGREVFGRHRDGTLVPVEIGLSPIESPAGHFVLASITDITERLRQERDAALQRSELAHLSRVAMLGELSGSLAHELNQPLAAILSNAQAALRFLDRPELKEELRETLIDIVENDKRAGEVIRRLRAMLKKEEVKHRRLDLNELISDVLRLYRSDLLNRRVAIKLELAPEVPEVEGDPVQLQQVLLNLMINACEAMEPVEEDRLLTIGTSVADPLAEHVQVAVSDIGKGITPGQLDHVFEAFVTSKSEGMGLGLAVCRTIIHAHQGRIWCENNPRRGATFRFELRRLDLQDGAQAANPGSDAIALRGSQPAAH